MQVFLPDTDFAETARVLDTRRLINQILRECKTLINGGWPHHPAAKLWRNHRVALARYALVGLDEIDRRGFAQKNMLEHRLWWEDRFCSLVYQEPSRSANLPSLCYKPEFTRAHRSQLLAKDFAHYSKYFNDVLPGALDYVWT